MPSIVSYNPYEVKVVAPILGSFADLWESRQESDIIYEENIDNKKQRLFHQVDEAPAVHDIAAVEAHQHIQKVTCHNPYSLAEPVLQVFACQCPECNHMQSFMVPEEEEMYYEEPMPVVSRFMPPAPPRLDTYDVIAACGAENPDSIIYNMMVRWFAKVSQVQMYFVPEGEECPPPQPEEYDFATWCQMTNSWWMKHFEHRQKKVHVNRHSHNGVW